MLQGARPEWPKSEVQSAESGDGVRRKGAVSSLSTSHGVWGSAVSSPSGVQWRNDGVAAGSSDGGALW